MSKVVISGDAYARHASLEVAGDMLTWRATRGDAAVAENIVTTIHDVREVHWIEQLWSLPGAALLALGALWVATRGALGGSLALAVGIALVAWRRTHPRRYLVLELGGRRLVLRVGPGSARDARSLAQQIGAAGDPPAVPPTLP